MKQLKRLIAAIAISAIPAISQGPVTEMWLTWFELMMISSSQQHRIVECDFVGHTAAIDGSMFRQAIFPCLVERIPDNSQNEEFRFDLNRNISKRRGGRTESRIVRPDALNYGPQ